MLLSYLKLSLRLLARNPFFTFINVAGLSVGFAVFFILWQYSQSELKSDQFHKDGDRIALVIAHSKMASGTSINETDYVALPPGSGYAVQNEVATLDEVTRIITQNHFQDLGNPEHTDKIFFTYKENTQEKLSFTEEKIIYADPNLFKFFTFPLEYGSPENVLSGPNSIVISSTIAQKYFGRDYPIGKILYMNDSIPFQVSGVFQPLPRNTHLSFDMVLSTNRIQRIVNDLSNLQLSTRIYIKRNETSNLEETALKIDQLFQKVFIPQWLKVAPSVEGKIWLLPLREIAFSDLFIIQKSKFFLSLLSVLSLVVLCMALANYVNLFVSANTKRLRELATRKTVGARSFDLIKQFVMEAAVINVISFLAALTLVQLVRRPMELFFDFYVPDWSSITLSSILFMFLIWLIALMITGVYPAVVTMRRSPTAIFGKWRTQNNSLRINSVLTVFQFISAVVLIVWIFLISDQIEYLLHKDRGITTSQVGVIDLPDYDGTKAQNIDVFLQELENLNFVEDFALSHSLVGDKSYNGIGIKKTPSDPFLVTESNGGVNERFIPFYGIKLVAGRNFSPNNPADYQSLIVSVKAMTKLGFTSPADAIGSTIMIEPGKYKLNHMVPAQIIGVMEDYVLHPFFKKDEVGTILTYRDKLHKDQHPRKVSVRIQLEKFSASINILEKAFNKYFPDQIFNWYFLDDRINQHYQTEKTSRNQILLFASLAILIACVGLLGMISNKVVEKTKEIGIRKVMGAELHQIAQILLNTTIKQIIMATVIGIPVAYYLTQQYLQKFAERIELKWWHFALPVVILLLIMLGTVAAVVWRAAKSNPVEALKYE